MDAAYFVKAAEFIVRRNVTDNVCCATICWDDANEKLVLRYATSQKCAEEDTEECEVAMAELIAEFPEIRLAETLCIPSSHTQRDRAAIVVFERKRVV